METGAWWEGRERVLNAHPIPPVPAQRRLQPPRAVRARIEWSRSGIEVIETEATSWVPGVVLVTIPDGRSMVRGVWLTTHDAPRPSFTPRKPRRSRRAWLLAVDAPSTRQGICRPMSNHG